MISNSWNKAGGESISQKVMGKVKPDEPLKNKMSYHRQSLAEIDPLVLEKEVGIVKSL